MTVRFQVGSPLLTIEVVSRACSVGKWLRPSGSPTCSIPRRLTTSHLPTTYNHFTNTIFSSGCARGGQGLHRMRRNARLTLRSRPSYVSSEFMLASRTSLPLDAPLPFAWRAWPARPSLGPIRRTLQLLSAFKEAGGAAGQSPTRRATALPATVATAGPSYSQHTVTRAEATPPAIRTDCVEYAVGAIRRRYRTCSDY